jgi:predicted DNA-binding ribbon-helix-helix protein
MDTAYPGIGPEQYALITRSIRIDDFVTSIRLEKRYWDVLDRLARGEGLSTSRYIVRVYDGALAARGVPPRHGKVCGLASLLRLVCTDWLVKRAGEMARSA